MSIKLCCRCSKQFFTTNNNAGKRAACPACGERCYVPLASTPTWRKPTLRVVPKVHSANKVLGKLVGSKNNKLVWAVECNDLKAVKRLLAAGADPNSINEEGCCVLLIAATWGFSEIIAALLKAGADMEFFPKPTLAMPPQMAAMEGRVEAMRVFLDAGLNLDCGWQNSSSLLLDAAFHGHADIVAMLLEAGMIPDFAAKCDVTPLMTAAHQGWGACVVQLLLAGANPQLKGYGMTAAEAALEEGHRDIAQLLETAMQDAVPAVQQKGDAMAFLCVNCGKVLKVKQKLGGKTIKCPNCSEQAAVPSLTRTAALKKPHPKKSTKASSILDDDIAEWLGESERHESVVLRRDIPRWLKLGQFDEINKRGPRVVRILLDLIREEEFNEAAMTALRGLTDPKAQELLCQEALARSNGYARLAVKQAELMPQDENQRVVFLFIIEQWQQYEAADPSGELLKAAVLSDDIMTRGRIAESALSGKRFEWLEIALGGKGCPRAGALSSIELRAATEFIAQQDQDFAVDLASHLPLQHAAERETELARKERASSESDTVKRTRLAQKVVDGSLKPDAPSIVLTGPEDDFRVDAIVVAPNSQQVAAASWSDVWLWNLPDGESGRRLRGHDGIIGSMAISNDSCWLVAGDFEGWLCIWALPNGDLVKKWRAHRDILSCLRFSPDGRYLASSCLDRTVKTWNCSDWSEAHCFDNDKSDTHEFSQSAVAKSLAFSPDGTWLVMGTEDAGVCARIWNAGDGSLLGEITEPAAYPNVTLFTADGRLVSGCRDGTVWIWRLPDLMLDLKLEGQSLGTDALAADADCRWLATGGYGETTLQFWDLATGDRLHSQPEEKQRDVRHIEFSTVNNLLVNSQAGEIWVWDLPAAQNLCVIDAFYSVQQLAVSSDGHWLLAGGTNISQGIKVWRLDELRLRN